MTQDVVYIYDKVEFMQSTLGEIQKDFNMGLVIDGTKDSCSIVVWSFVDYEVEPYTILRHPKTDTWWVVSHDKVTRRMNDSGYLYIHELDLLGAIELLNARDLIDSGFNDNRYTIEDFLERLFTLSYFDYRKDGTNYTPQFVSNQLDLTQMVEYIKTYENYTTLSALREFLDGYNCCAKLSWNTRTILPGNQVQLTRPIITILSKTGNSNLTTHTMDHFDDIRQTKTLDKNSYGAVVVSNAENVISSISKTYPSVGGVKTTSHEYNIKADNSVIRLPSKVYQGNWIKLVTTQPPVRWDAVVDEQNLGGNINVNPLSNASFNKMINDILTTVRNNDESGDFYNALVTNINGNKNFILEEILKSATITAYNGNEIDASNGNIIKGENVPYLTNLYFYSKAAIGNLIFCDKETKDMLKLPWQGIAWERGSDEITGFDCFEPIGGAESRIEVENYKNTDLQYDMNVDGTHQYTYYIFSLGNNYVKIQTRTFSGGDTYKIYFRTNAQWIVNYIPMSDLKIKVDNLRDRQDVQLYNQNGKITDNIAFSKVLNSYSKEISSDTITKYKQYTNFNNIPKVGSFVIDGNKTYVINNISYTFTQNETSNPTTDFGYFIDCEFTMSQYCSTKSLMVNPNTNIRDYGIPQNYNVKRKQVYRDYYELTYVAQDDADTNYYLPQRTIFTFTHYPNEDIDYTGIMKITYANEIEGNSSYYYQLETTKYNLNKMFYVVLDFKDNNIIGYGNENVYSGFVISRIFSGTIDTFNTPISYVDENGEFESISIRFANKNALSNAYESYLEDQSGSSAFINAGKTLYNYSVFIPEEIYELVENSSSFEIEEDQYNKDAIEVPFFEYGCQIADTLDVLIGDNILYNYSSDYIYFYSYVYGDNLTQENATTENGVNTIFNPPMLVIDDSAVLTYALATHKLTLRLYSGTSYAKETREFTNFTARSFAVGKDYAIFRHAYNLVTNEEKIDLMFIAKKVPSSNISSNTLSIEINHYKLH